MMAGSIGQPKVRGKRLEKGTKTERGTLPKKCKGPREGIRGLFNDLDDEFFMLCLDGSR